MRLTPNFEQKAAEHPGWTLAAIGLNEDNSVGWGWVLDSTVLPNDLTGGTVRLVGAKRVKVVRTTLFGETLGEWNLELPCAIRDRLSVQIGPSSIAIVGEFAADSLEGVNAFVFSHEGGLLTSGTLGYGVAQVAQSGAHYWVVYSDAGIYGMEPGQSSSRAPGAAGLACFDAKLERLWFYPGSKVTEPLAVRFVGCEALNVSDRSVTAMPDVDILVNYDLLTGKVDFDEILSESLSEASALLFNMDYLATIAFNGAELSASLFKRSAAVYTQCASINFDLGTSGSKTWLTARGDFAIIYWGRSLFQLRLDKLLAYDSNCRTT